ncbi:MAG: glycoside hydrolase family 20 zincin-like fold domain-containing protein [Armatimonadota bacterium]|nr:glycoside hydrolase family 20 zincin-like fold domain-containing protein [Armatimonadota bacterium]
MHKRLASLTLAAALLVSLAVSAQASIPTNIVFSDDFQGADYPAGRNLPDTLLWDGTALDDVEVNSNGTCVKFSGQSTSRNAYHDIVPAYAGSGNIIWVHFLAQPGTGTDTNWGIWMDDPSGNNLARYYGSATSCKGRIGGTNTVTIGANLNPGWNDLDVRINTSANTCEFYINGCILGTLDHGTTPGNTLGRIKFEQVANSLAVGQYLFFDEMRLGQQPAAPTVPPAAPSVIIPSSGAIVTTNTPAVQWLGNPHDKYEVHINTTNNSADANGWDSGEVSSTAISCTTGILPGPGRYYVFVRLRNAIGWGPWSAAGYYFDVVGPGMPVVTSPASGSYATTRTPTIQWTGDAHDGYEVHINTTNNSADTDGWNSGVVTSAASSCVSGTLQNDVRYYVFVRLRNGAGWGPWSAAGYYFDVIIAPTIIPQPQQLTWKPGTGFQVDDSTRIVMNTTPDEKDTFTANLLRRKVWDMTGHLPQIVSGGPGAPTSNVIAIGDPVKNTAVSSIIASWPEAAGKTPKSEGYMLGLKNDSIVIRGFDQRGAFYGVQTLIQLMEYYGASQITGLFTYDYPELAWRGTMVRVWDSMDATYLKEVISEIMARYKLNVLQLDLGLGFIWPSHPELYYNLPPEEQRANPTTLDMVVPVADYAKQYFMEVIPAGPSWSHSDGLVTAATLNTLLRENRSEADPAPSLETLCHRDTTAQQIIHDLWTDMINWLHPNYIHAGWDEISAIGHSSCPHCAGVNKNTLFKEFLQSDRNWMAARGIGMVMWADMLRPDMNGGSPWNLSQTAGTMPNDIILEDWEYTEVHDNAASAQRWNSFGLPWLASPYGGYAPYEDNVDNWASIAYTYSGNGMVAFNKFRCGSKQGVLTYSFQHREVANFVFYGEWGWSPGRPPSPPTPYDAFAIVRQQSSPDPPASFSASLAGQNVSLSWTNPPDSTFQGVWVCYRTDQYPTDPIDGIFVCDLNGSPNGSMNFTHTAAPLGATIYYAAFSHDGVRHFSPVATDSVPNGSPLALSDLSSFPDGRTVNVAGGVVTSIYQNCFYVQTESRINGLRVEATEPVTVGQVVTVLGPLGRTGHERSITALSVTGTGQKLLTDPCLQPFALNNKAIGGADNGSIPGSGGVGANNVGSLTIMIGKVRNPDPGGAFFYLNDGSIPGGIKVKLTETKTAVYVPTQEFVSVVGVSSLDTDGTAIIWPRSQADIVPLRQ